MQTVIETETYLRDLKEAGLSQQERAAVVNYVALNPGERNELKATLGAIARAYRRRK